MDRQDVWALPTSMESFEICVRGLASATELLVHPSELKKAEIMDLFRHLAELYEAYDCRVSVASLVEIFHDHLTAYVTRFRRCVMRKEAELPPRLSTITQELRLALNQLHESTRQRVSRYIILDHERG